MWLSGPGQDAVDIFWSLCGETEGFPRSLERPLALALPVALVKMPRLCLQDIEHWVNQREVPFTFSCRNREVRGCLIAQSGHGLLFVDGTDPEDEQRLTMAHEISHFLLDYWLPRERAMGKLGPQISDVLDGLRPATVTERVHAVLGSISIGPYTSLMERGDGQNAIVWDIENRADQVALALLAPPESVLPLLDLSQSGYAQRLRAATNVLRGTFGLPSAVATTYGHTLLVSVGRGPSWAESLDLR